MQADTELSVSCVVHAESIRQGATFTSFMEVQIECMATPKTHDSKLSFQGHLPWSGICLRPIRTGGVYPGWGQVH